MVSQEELTEPLLRKEEENPQNVPLPEEADEEQVCARQRGARVDDANETNDNNDNNNDSPPTAVGGVSAREELWEMANLGLPLAVSFFCRMGMASTDSAFVGHINDDKHTSETYLAAAVLSDMVVNVFITPPLAFNGVLNALVGQAVGSGNPKMAGIWLQQSVFWLTLSLIPCTIAFLYVEPVLLLLGFPPNVSAVAGYYARFNMLWPIPNGIYQCMRFYFQAQGLPRPAMYNNILFLFVNAALNWIFVFGGPFPGWKGFGFVGAAVSISISRIMQGVVYFLYMFVYKKHHLNTWPEAGLSFSHHTNARTLEFMKQSLPNMGTYLFQVLTSQATTVLVGRLGERAIAASSALSTVSIPWAGALSATCSMMTGVRVGHHLGRGDTAAAKQASWIVLYIITAVNVVMSVIFLSPLRRPMLDIATNSEDVLTLAAIVVPAMLAGTYLNGIVSNITSGVFAGMGRPFIATILSFGLELPMSIGGVAIYVLVFHGNLLGVYWWGAISGGIEMIIVLAIMMRTDWQKCADEAKRRQEAQVTTNAEGESAENENDQSVGEADACASDPGTDGTVGSSSIEAAEEQP